MLGRLFDWLGLVVVPIVAFLDALLTLCANTPEPTVAVNSIAAAPTIAPYISSLLFASFVLFVVVVIAIC
jgi:hypothetical protein